MQWKMGTLILLSGQLFFPLYCSQLLFLQNCHSVNCWCYVLELYSA